MNRLNSIQTVIGVLFLCGSVAWGQTDTALADEKPDTDVAVSVDIATEVAELQPVSADSSEERSNGGGMVRGTGRRMGGGMMGGGGMSGRGGMLGGAYGGSNLMYGDSTGTSEDMAVAFSYQNPLGSIMDSVLVIPTEDLSVEAMKVIQEDMTIMGRILYKRIRPDGDYDMFSGYHTTTLRGNLLGVGGSTVEGMYLQDYGAIYFLRVKMPLLPPIQTEEVKQEEPVTDKVWAQTKQELQTRSNSGYSPWKTNTVRVRTAQKPRFDAEKVAELKQNLLNTLRHASNIRSLQADEWITVVVVGGGIQNVSKQVVTKTPNTDRAEALNYLFDTQFSSTGASGQTVLTMRVKKADVDAAAKKEISQEEFEKRVKMFTYAAAGDAKPQPTSIGLSLPAPSQTKPPASSNSGR